MPDHLQLAKPSLAYAKLVATPTDTAWSQVYNAGNLFACLSLSLSQPDAEVSLHLVGKEVFNNLEAEFFTLEEKTLESIKSALETSIQALPSAVTLNMTLAYFKDHTLYVYIAGSGRIIMKRRNKTGVLLDKKQGESTDVVSASGYLENDDTVILESRQFADDMPAQTITSALELALPNDIAEALSPQIHEKDDGGQAAIIIVFHGISKSFAEDEKTIEDEVEEEEEEEKMDQLHHEHFSDEKDAEDEEDFEEEQFSKKRSFKLPSLPSLSFAGPLLRKFKIKNIRMPHRKRLFLSIALILAALLFFSIFSTKQREEQVRTKALFEQIYTPAQKSYDEGMALKSLNESLSREDFTKAQTLLNNGSSQFKDGSDEKKKIAELLQKVEAELGSSGNPQSSNAKEVQAETGSILAVAKTNPEGKGFAEDQDTVYFVTTKAIVSVAKSDAKKGEIVKNESSWENPRGIAVYQGNLYVLDAKNAILKFVEVSGGYSESNYFQGTKPDLNRAQAIAIDGSVWLLFADGTIGKYTRGARDNFNVSGLDKAFSSPTKIITSLDMENIYILDRGNSRIVKLAKSGKFESQITSSIIKQATEFEILENDKKANVLSGGKIYQLDLP